MKKRKADEIEAKRKADEVSLCVVGVFCVIVEFAFRIKAEAKRKADEAEKIRLADEVENKRKADEVKLLRYYVLFK